MACAFHLPPRQARRVGRECIEAIFEFTTAVGRGTGVIRLSPSADEAGEMKVWHIATTLEELDGVAERIGDNRPAGAAYPRNFGGVNWEDIREKAVAYDGHEPTVLVIGGAHAGQSIAARGYSYAQSTLLDAALTVVQHPADSRDTHVRCGRARRAALVVL